MKHAVRLRPRHRPLAQGTLKRISCTTRPFAFRLPRSCGRAVIAQRPDPLRVAFTQNTWQRIFGSRNLLKTSRLCWLAPGRGVTPLQRAFGDSNCLLRPPSDQCEELVVLVAL